MRFGRHTNHPLDYFIVLAGYGELEVTMLACLVAVEGQVDYPIRQLFKRTTAENRIKLARQALLPNTPMRA
jgi:hypothetical protein